MYGFMPDSILNIFSTEPVTMNNHQMGVPPSAFAESAGLVSNFNILSTNVDRQGNPFVSSMEGKAGLPIYTTQYHPEKVQFEWRPDEVINHSLDSIMANHYLALFFVNQTKSNTRSFPSVEAENAALIYNYSPIFSAPFEPSFQVSSFSSTVGFLHPFLEWPKLALVASWRRRSRCERREVVAYLPC